MTRPASGRPVTVRALVTAAALLPAAALVLPAARRAPGYATGAPPGFSGGFSESSCHACHFHEEVNAPPGRVAIAGVPERFTPGARYPLTVTLTRPGMKLAGFQLTARFKDGAQAGALAPEPQAQDRLRIDEQRGVQYASQSAAVSVASSATASWTLTWTAPAGPGPIVFHVAANAADGDETVEGDYVYTATAESTPAGLRSPANQPLVVSRSR